MRRNSQRSGVRGQESEVRSQGKKVKGLYGQPFVNEDGELCRYATRWECFWLSLVFQVGFIALGILLYLSRCAYHSFFAGQWVWVF